MQLPKLGRGQRIAAGLGAFLMLLGFVAGADGYQESPNYGWAWAIAIMTAFAILAIGPGKASE